MNRIKELRLKQNWRQDDLAAMLNTRKNTISRYENGERGLDVETINKLCDIFGCTSDYLLGRSDQRRSGITDEEVALVNAFRELSDAGKEYVLHSLALAALAHSEKSGTVPDVEAAP